MPVLGQTIVDTADGEAQTLVAGVAGGLTAAGSTTADALALSANSRFHRIGTAAASTGVRLPAPTGSIDGIHYDIRNDGANTVNIYPHTGGKINGGTADAAVTLAAGGRNTLVWSSTDGTWYRF